ncbi:hypothetical protein CBR_g3011 [Chara braunii]|uniref:Uncharacterized protein n=1 Tax=Chara braunii TaxID=69332 RepID=A0A388KEH8_CHABU|nr:hypothetical protein CBR_g3011 [Chara braunii]|eukprot:GBG68465.1 hypothetical protein CBR_g3011 [Chara braunii]
MMGKDGLASTPAIGIDVGTSHTSVAVWQDGKVSVIPDERNVRRSPAYVGFTDTQRFVGSRALLEGENHAENSTFELKRVIGRYYDDSALQEAMQWWPFRVLSGKESDSHSLPVIAIDTEIDRRRSFTPEELLAMLLMKIKKQAEQHLRMEAMELSAVITVPACFSNSQRQATKDAARIAGLKVLRLTSEHVAATVHYAYEALLKMHGVPSAVVSSSSESDGRMNGEGSSAIGLQKKLMVFHLGGGAFDVSVIALDLCGGAEKTPAGTEMIKVLAVSGDVNLGGMDFDVRMMKIVEGKLQQQHGIDASRLAPRDRWRLRSACVQAKEKLSMLTNVPVELEFRSGVDGGRIDFMAMVTRKEFEESTIDLIRRMHGCVRNVLTDSMVRASDIAEVVMIGGSTRMPMIAALLRRLVSGKRQKTHPDEIVVQGASIHAATLHAHCRDKPDRSNAVVDAACAAWLRLRTSVIADVPPFDLEVCDSNGWVRSTIHTRRMVMPCNQRFHCSDGDFLMLKPMSSQRSCPTHADDDGRSACVRQRDIRPSVKLLSASARSPPVEQHAILSVRVDNDGVFEFSPEPSISLPLSCRVLPRVRQVQHDTWVNKKRKFELDVRVQKPWLGLSKAQMEEIDHDNRRYKQLERDLSERSAARHSLEAYVYQSEQMVGQWLSDRWGRSRAEEQLDQLTTWLKSNATTSVDSLEYRKREEDLRSLFEQLERSDDQNEANQRQGLQKSILAASCRPDKQVCRREDILPLAMAKRVCIPVGRTLSYPFSVRDAPLLSQALRFIGRGMRGAQALASNLLRGYLSKSSRKA